MQDEAHRLRTVEQLADEQAARRLGVPPAQVKALIVRRAERLERAELRVDHVAVGPIRELVDRELHAHPEMSFEEIAQRAGWADWRDPARMLGYKPMPRRAGGGCPTRIGVRAAERIVVALGIGPAESEIEGI